MDLIRWGLTILFGAFAGSFLGAYMKKKGENLATHEDIGKLVAQMEAVTKATKEIEANILNKSWNRQRHWEMRRDAIFNVMQALGKADESLHSFSNVIDLQNKLGDSHALQFTHERAASRLIEDIDDFDKKRALSLIVCDTPMNDSLMALKKDMRDLASKLMEGESVRYADVVPKLRPNFAMAFALARRELEIEKDQAVTP